MTEKDRRFIGQLYIENFEKLFYYALSCVKDREVAQDLVIETFVDAIKKVADLSAHENPHGWLREALKFEIKLYFRRAKCTPQIVPYNEETVPSPPQSADLNDPEISLLYKSGLTDIEQEECRLYFLEDLTHNQVAEKLGITVSASQKRRERLRNKLKRKWKKIF